MDSGLDGRGFLRWLGGCFECEVLFVCQGHCLNAPQFSKLVAFFGLISYKSDEQYICKLYQVTLRRWFSQLDQFSVLWSLWAICQDLSFRIPQYWWWSGAKEASKMNLFPRINNAKQILAGKMMNEYRRHRQGAT